MRIRFTNLNSYSGWEVQPSTSAGSSWEAEDSLKGVLEVLTGYAPVVCGAWCWPRWPFPSCKGELFLWTFGLHWLDQWLPFRHWGHSPGVLMSPVGGGIITPLLGWEWQSFFICPGFSLWKHLAGEELKLFLKAAQIVWASMVCLWACVPIFNTLGRNQQGCHFDE